MIIHVYSVMRNEERMLPYFLRHYSTFAEKIFIFNDKSTDRTAEIAKAHPKVELFDLENDLTFEGRPIVNNIAMNKAFTEGYKKYSRGVADWVMVADGDEFIYRQKLVDTLARCKKDGVKVLRGCGFSMISDTFPTTDGQIYDECCYGVRNVQFDKAVIFDPSIEVDFAQGRHYTYPPEGVRIEKAQISFLHYQHMSKEYYLSRMDNFSRRMYSKRKAANRIRAGLAFFDRTPLIKVI